MFIEYFTKKFNDEKHLKITDVSMQTLDLLKNYEWPGNIRDLQNAIQSAMILAREGVLTTEHLPLRVKGYAVTENSTTEVAAGLDENLRQISSKLEKDLILEALHQCSYNRASTANLLKISRKTLFNKMKFYDL